MNPLLRKIAVVLLSVVIIYFGFSFFVVSWFNYFSTPKRLYISNEHILFEKIKKKYNVQEIERSPKLEKEIDAKKDAVTYRIYLYSQVYCNRNRYELTPESEDIFKEIDLLKIDTIFHKYEIVFCCKMYNTNGISFSYTRT